METKFIYPTHPSSYEICETDLLVLASFKTRLSASNSKSLITIGHPMPEPHLVFRNCPQSIDLLIQRNLLTSWLVGHLKSKIGTELLFKPTRCFKNEALRLKPKSETKTNPAQRRKVNLSEAKDPCFEEVINALTIQAFSSSLLEKHQFFVERCTADELQQIVRLARLQIDRLVSTKAGSYLSKALICRSEEFHSFIVSYCMQNLKQMACCDFSCRLLRTVLRRHVPMRPLVLRMFEEDFHLCLEAFPSIFLLTEAIRLSNDPLEFDFILQRLLREPFRLLSSRYFKRVLVTFVEHCSEKQLAAVERCLDIPEMMGKHLNDKFLTLILIMIGFRNPLSCLNSLEVWVHWAPHQLGKAKYFMLFAQRLVDTHLRSHWMARLHSILVRLQLNAFGRRVPREAAPEHTLFLFLDYLILSTWNAQQFNSKRLVRQINWIKYHIRCCSP